MQVLSRPRPHNSPPLSNSDAAKQKIDEALALLAPSRVDNQELKEIFEQADIDLEGYEPHVKAIDFDRGTRDVSEHGTALRNKAEGATDTLQTGEQDYQSVSGKTKLMVSLVEGALEDIGQSNSRATWRLTSGLNDLLYVQESNLPGLDASLHRSARLLNEELDPYLTEVEEDAPGRDVGRHADDIEEIWQLADRQVRSGPVYSRSIERQFGSAHGYLVKAREAL